MCLFLSQRTKKPFSSLCIRYSLQRAWPADSSRPEARWTPWATLTVPVLLLVYHKVLWHDVHGDGLCSPGLGSWGELSWSILCHSCAGTDWYPADCQEQGFLLNERAELDVGDYPLRNNFGVRLLILLLPHMKCRISLLWLVGLRCVFWTWVSFLLFLPPGSSKFWCNMWLSLGYR